MLDLNCPYFLFLIKPERQVYGAEVHERLYLGRKQHLSTPEESRRARSHSLEALEELTELDIERLVEEISLCETISALGQASAWKF